ncbi:MAG: hypothetical protein HY673_13935 [Chloroflexi bacterium]|nr:hypothetical protein [Chloroflexota bacterium]
MRVLVAERGEIISKGEAALVVEFFDWGFRVISPKFGVQEYCSDVERLLAGPDLTDVRLNALRAWVIREKESNNASTPLS